MTNEPDPRPTPSPQHSGQVSAEERANRLVDETVMPAFTSSQLWTSETTVETFRTNIIATIRDAERQARVEGVKEGRGAEYDVWRLFLFTGMPQLKEMWERRWPETEYSADDQATLFGLYGDSRHTEGVKEGEARTLAAAGKPKAWMVSRDTDYESREFFITKEAAMANASLGVVDTHITPLYALQPASDSLNEYVAGKLAEYDRLAIELKEAKRKNRLVLCTYCGHISERNPDGEPHEELVKRMEEHLSDCPTHPINLLVHLEARVKELEGARGKLRGLVEKWRKSERFHCGACTQRCHDADELETLLNPSTSSGSDSREQGVRGE